MDERSRSVEQRTGDPTPNRPRRTGFATVRAVAGPDFIIGGASKSGTTSMFRWLGSHPDVEVARRKELRFFDGYNAERGWDWYLRQFPDGGVTGEASPRYLTDADPEEIERRVPGVKMIFLLREPVARAYSDYWMHRAMGTDDRSFEAALESPAVWRRCIETGEYHRHLQRYRDVMGEERMCVLFTEDLEADPRGTFGGVCRYLGVDAIDTATVGSVVNARVGYRSARVRRVAERLPRPVQRVVGRANTTPFVYPPMAPRTRDRLSAHFAPHNAALARFLGTAVPWG